MVITQPFVLTHAMLFFSGIALSLQQTPRGSLLEEATWQDSHKYVAPQRARSY